MLNRLGLFSIFLIFFAAASCTKVEQDRYYSQQEVDRITDSARNASYLKAKKAADEDLRIRKEIEIRQRMELLKKAKRTGTTAPAAP